MKKRSEQNASKKIKIIFSEHANEQLKRRKILKKIVVETIEDPQHKIKSYKDRELRQKSFSGKILEVVTVKEESNLIVITQYYLERN